VSWNTAADETLIAGARSRPVRASKVCTAPSSVATSSVRESGASASARACPDGWRSKCSAPERASHAITVEPSAQQPEANSTRLSRLNCISPAPKRTVLLKSGRPDGSSRTSTLESAAPAACRCVARSRPSGEMAVHDTGSA
jgi:hypothetical protein